MFKSKKRPARREAGEPGGRRPQAAPQAGRPAVQHSIIPAGLTVTGDLLSTGDLHVEGVIHGNITCRALTLVGQPVVEGSVEAEAIRIAGRFEGNVRARKVTLTNSARMTGDIQYETLEVESGAWFEGKTSRRAAPK